MGSFEKSELGIQKWLSQKRTTLTIKPELSNRLSNNNNNNPLYSPNHC